MKGFEVSIGDETLCGSVSFGIILITLTVVRDEVRLDFYGADYQTHNECRWIDLRKLAKGRQITIRVKDIAENSECVITPMDREVMMQHYKMMKEWLTREGAL